MDVALAILAAWLTFGFTGLLLRWTNEALVEDKDRLRATYIHWWPEAMLGPYGFLHWLFTIMGNVVVLMNSRK